MHRPYSRPPARGEHGASSRTRVGSMQLPATLFSLAIVSGPLSAQTPYFPGPGDAWERRTPEQVGMNAALLAEAVAGATEWNQPRDLLEMHTATLGREPVGEAVGPFKERGPATGVVIRNGFIVADWGDPWRVDPTYSVTASRILASVVE